MLCYRWCSSCFVRQVDDKFFSGWFLNSWWYDDDDFTKKKFVTFNFLKPNMPFWHWNLWFRLDLWVGGWQRFSDRLGRHPLNSWVWAWTLNVQASLKSWKCYENWDIYYLYINNNLASFMKKYWYLSLKQTNYSRKKISKDAKY